MRAHTRAPGLHRRTPLYAAAIVAVACATVRLPISSAPSGWLMVGVVVAATIGFALPVGIGTVGIWRKQGSFCEPVLVVCAFSFTWAWALIAWTLAALFSGIYIRRYRTTPGGMAAGASQQIVAAAVAMGESLVGALALNLVPVQRLFGFACGAAMGVAGLLLAEQHTALLLLMALPYAALLVGNANASRVQREKERMEALITLGHKLHRATDEDEVVSVVCQTTADLQGCETTFVRDTAPIAGEAGAQVPALDGSPWLIAPVRRGPPSFQGRYRRDEHRLMEVVVGVADAAIDNVRLVRHHIELARVDPVTGIPNRLAMRDHLESEVAQAIRTGEPLAVLFIDFDRFKEINDTLGHDAGDAALTEVGRRLQTALRAGDIVGRWGGDEFVAIVRAPDGGIGAWAAGDRIRAALTDTEVEVPGGKVTVTASVGGALLGLHGRSARELVAAADAAASEAKAAGRDRMVIAPEPALNA